MRSPRQLVRHGIAVFLLPFLVATTWSQPFLWKIDGPKPSYLFGTIHSPDPRVAKIGPETMDAVEGSDVLYTEIAFDPQTLVSVIPLLMDPSGKALRERLGEEVYAQLDKSLARISPKLSAEAFEGMKIWGILLTLAVLEHQLKYPGSKAIDELLWNAAKARGLETRGLESPIEQTEGLDELTEDEQVALLKDSLDLEAAYRAEGKHPLEAIVVAYQSGDLAVIQAEMDTQLDLDDPVAAKLHESLFLQRNRRFAERIHNAIAEHPDQSFFFAIGAAHYSGQENLLELLRAKGLKIERAGAEAARAQ